MKKCVFAGDWTLEKTVGVHRFAYQVLLALDRILEETNSNADIELLVPCNSNFCPGFQRIKLIKKGYIRKKTEKHLWQQITFPWYVRSHGATGVDLALALPVWGCDICAIHDCILEAFPEGFRDHKLFRKIYLLKARQSARLKNRKILTVSHNAKEEIQKYYGISDERITVLGNGWEHMYPVQTDESVFEKIPNVKKGRYFFSLGSKYKHKNFAWVLKTAAKNPKYQFVVSGGDHFSDNSGELQQEKLANVFFTGHLNDGELKALMEHCCGFIQPSFYEGFGIPPLEALSMGKRIIVSNASCLPEIYQDTAYYIDPHGDGCDMDALLSNTVAYPDKVLETYTWHNAAMMLLKVLEEG